MGTFPIKIRVLRKIAPESSPESSAKSLSRKFFGVPFFCPWQGFLMAFPNLSGHYSCDWSEYVNVIVTNGKKHPKKICIKNFGGTLAEGSRRGFRRPNSLCRCWFSQQNTVHKEFRGRGGGLRGSWGWGLRSNFGAPFLYVYVLFWGLRLERLVNHLPVNSGSE